MSHEEKNNICKISEQNPEWKQIIMGDDESIDFVQKNYEREYLDALLRIDPAYGPARSDFLRYLILNKIGGVYIDNKSGISVPLSTVIKDDDEFVIIQWDNAKGEAEENMGVHPELAHVAGGEYVNWVIISAPDHPFLVSVIDKVMDNIVNYSRRVMGTGKQGTLRTTGPIAFTAAIAPILEMYQHRRITSYSSGFRYATSGDMSTHTLTPHLHYSRLMHSIVRPAPNDNLSARIAFTLTRPILMALAQIRHLTGC